MLDRLTHRAGQVLARLLRDEGRSGTEPEHEKGGRGIPSPPTAHENESDERDGRQRHEHDRRVDDQRVQRQPEDVGETQGWSSEGGRHRSSLITGAAQRQVLPC